MVVKLIDAGYNRKDIGIITPYSLQVKLIKSMLERNDIDNITVGSVEEFQGDERVFILISTVRTFLGSNATDTDTTHQLAFINCPKRINVAVSRARYICLFSIFISGKFLIKIINIKLSLFQSIIDGFWEGDFTSTRSKLESIDRRMQK